MAYLLGQPARYLPPYVHFEGHLSAAQCDAAIALGEALTWQKGTVENDQQGVRRSEVAWVSWSDDVDWLYQKLAAVCDAVRTHWYPFALSGMVEPLQLTRYRATEQGHYDWHRDMGESGRALRKLSLMLQLSEPDSYAGGELEIMSGACQVAQKSRGTLIAFPAWEMHRVTQVTRGERVSLVTWVHGPPFT